MSIASVSRAYTSPETSSTRDARADDGSAAQSFAGILSGAMNTQAPKLADTSRKDGTSDLDDSDSTDETPDSGKPGATVSKDASTASSGGATSTTDVVRSIAALDPTMQAKLARVINRVENETGHTVQVAETYRSQARQDALYAQGRDTAGPVVTWTHNSKHTQGRAADLVLDGGTGSSDAYQTLQRIANEEGLRTLGAKDPGHVELPGSATTAKTPGDTMSANPAEPADASGPGQISIARLAQVANVASVANVKMAQPAPVARVAQVSNAAVSATAASDGKTARDSSSDSGAQSQSGNGYSALSAAVAMRAASPTAFSAEVVAAAAAPTGAERAEKVIAALDSAPVRPLSQITMAVDAGNGTTDRVQLAMRGSSLNTTIDASDARGAQAMSTHSDELVSALNRDGVQLDSLRIRAASTGTTNVAATVGGQGSAPSNDASGQSRFDRGSAWNQQENQQQRQRSQQDRRQQQQQQQRQQRGGQQ